MQPLVQAIVGLAHGLHLTATAEGVETEDELAVLQAVGRVKVQGFLLGRLVPADQWENPGPRRQKTEVRSQNPESRRRG